MNMKFELEPYHRDVTDDVLLHDLSQVAKALGKDRVTIDEYTERGHYNRSTLQRRFGSWFKALERAGLQHTRTLHVTEQQYFENLENVWRRLGRQPRYDEMRKPLSQYSAGAYEYRFGTWRQALQRFVALVNAGETSDELSGGDRHLASPLSKGNQKNPSWRLRFLVMRRDGFKCVACGRSPAKEAGIELEVDHRVPRSKGGVTTLDNLQTLCSQCNVGKSDLDFN